ncbi:MAG TPA: GNAT family N-acetyltransferase [Methanoregulaceae archaeon]|nr:GNAT family N-acetyltransferase [Methanoregulaceae archaeon]
MVQNEEYSVKIVKEWDYLSLIDLYRAGGWWKQEWYTSQIPVLIRSSFAFAVAIECKSGKTVGMGRVISDSVSDAYIQDLVTLPEYRKLGIGAKIVGTLVKFCKENHIEWIALIAEPGTEEFYIPLGFSRMIDYVPMLLKEADD